MCAGRQLSAAGAGVRDDSGRFESYTIQIQIRVIMKIVRIIMMIMICPKEYTLPSIAKLNRIVISYLTIIKQQYVMDTLIFIELIICYLSNDELSS